MAWIHDIAGVIAGVALVALAISGIIGNVRLSRLERQMVEYRQNASHEADEVAYGGEDDAGDAQGLGTS